MKRLNKWIWQKAEWPHFTWKADVLLPLLSKAIGLLAGLKAEQEAGAAMPGFGQGAREPRLAPGDGGARA